MGNQNQKSGGFIDTVINAITGAFTKFVGTFKRHGFLYCLFVMLLLVLFYTLIVNPIRIDKIVEKRFEMMYEQNKAKEAAQIEEAMNRRLNADVVLGDIMVKLLDKYSSIHRVILLEGHNSIQSHSGLDFLYYSCSMEMLSAESHTLSYLSEDLQRQMRVNIIGNNMINTLKHRRYIHYDKIAQCKHPDHRLVHKIAATGDDELIIFPFLDKAGEPIVLLVISGVSLEVDDIVDYVEDFRKQIESTLL